jgi:hypothetical protein
MKKLFVLMIASTFSVGLFAQAGQEKKMEHKEKKMEHHMGMHKMKDCVMMEDGKMMVMEGGKTMAMDKDMTMKNGAVVMQNGSVKWKNGKTTMLKDGECVYMDVRWVKWVR